MTGKTDSLTCSLVANYRCEIDGTPTDQGVRINLQIQTGVARMSIGETISCDGGASQLVIGRADLDLNCTAVSFGGVSCTLDSGTIEGALPE